MIKTGVIGDCLLWLWLYNDYVMMSYDMLEKTVVYLTCNIPRVNVLCVLYWLVVWNKEVFQRAQLCLIVLTVGCVCHIASFPTDTFNWFPIQSGARVSLTNWVFDTTNKVSTDFRYVCVCTYIAINILWQEEMKIWASWGELQKAAKNWIHLRTVFYMEHESVFLKACWKTTFVSSLDK